MTARTCALGKATMILNFPQRVYKTLLCAARSPFPLFRKATLVLTTLSDSHSALSDSLQPKGCSLPSSSVPGILRLEWAAISSSWGSSQPRGQTWVSWWIFYHLSHPVLRRDRQQAPPGVTCSKPMSSPNQNLIPKLNYWLNNSTTK